MFKLGSKLLITAVLLAIGLSLSGTPASAQQIVLVNDSASGGGGAGGAVPIVSTDGEPDVGQTRDVPGASGSAPGAGEQTVVEMECAGFTLRCLVVVWTLRYLGLGT